MAGCICAPPSLTVFQAKDLAPGKGPALSSDRSLPNLAQSDRAGTGDASARSLTYDRFNTVSSRQFVSNACRLLAPHQAKDPTCHRAGKKPNTNRA
jgi:hypothetical protein